ncbi:MAG TPA: DUF4105 domain-containing protein [Kofleriaceae bacterium]
MALVVLLAAASASAQPAITDDHPQVELVTIGIGALPWERHGHIAVCVTQKGLRASLAHREPFDRCFNYGYADFHHPIQMSWGFVRGTHSFWVGTETPEAMFEIYLAEDRTVWVQPLPLDAAQKAKMIAKLEDDTLDAHRYYAYDHFTNNCATRIRDIIDSVTDHALSTMPAPPDDRTLRDYARDGFTGMPVPLVITDLILGRSGDVVPTYWDRMFLPQYLREAVALEWGVTPYKLFERNQCIADPDPSCDTRGIPSVEHPNSGRWLFALLIFMLTSPVWITRAGGRQQRAGLAMAVVPYWLIGVALTVLAVASPLPYFRMNEMVLVWLPLDLLVVFLSPARQVTYARARVAMLALIALLRVVHVLHQPLWAPMLWPLIPMTTVAFWPKRWR